MYRNYLLNNGFWTKKRSNSEIFLKHDLNIGGLYAVIQKEGFNRGIKIIIRRKKYFFENIHKGDFFDINRMYSDLFNDLKTIFIGVLNLCKKESFLFETTKIKLLNVL